MGFTKRQLKQQTEVDQDTLELVEVFDLRLQYEMLHGESMEDVRRRLIQQADREFTNLLEKRAEALKAQAKEVEHWEQQRLFDPPNASDVVREAGFQLNSALRAAGAEIIETDPDDEPEDEPDSEREPELAVVQPARNGRRSGR